MPDGVERVVEGLVSGGVVLVASLPDTNLDFLIRRCDDTPELQTVALAREEEGVGICTGAYLGGHLGYQWGNTTHNPTHPSGLAGGIQGGYNWQTGALVLGGEADLTISGAHDTFAPWKFSNPWFGTLRARAGYGFSNILVYGTVGLALIFLIAIEVMWVVLLLGVEISYVYQNLYGLLRATEQRIEDEPRFDLYFALRAMVEIARRFEKREEAPSSYRMAEQFAATDAQMLRVLRKLEDSRLVNVVGGEYPGFVPGCDADRISVEEVVHHVEGDQRALPPPATEEREHDAVAYLFERLDSCVADGLNRLTIGQMVHDLYSPRVVRADDATRASRADV